MLDGSHRRLGTSVRPVDSSLVSSPSLTPAGRAAIDGLLAATPVLIELGERFARQGHELVLVGGPVRDVLLGRPGNDWDFATSARPEQIEKAVDGWADAVWDVGREFGTIGVRKDDHPLEITTYRTDAYDPASRKPEVRFGDTLEGDLSR